MNSNLRVVHIITGLNQGGAEAMLTKVSGALRERCEIQVISLLDEGVYGKTLKEMGIPVHCLHMKRGSFSWKAFGQLRNLLKKIHPDVVQTWMYHADLIGGIATKTSADSKVFWNIRQGNVSSDANSIATRCVVRLNAFLSRFIPTKVVVNSNVGRQVHQGIGYAASKMIVIPNAFDIHRFKSDHAARIKFRAELGIDPQLPVLGMVARFDPQKDHETLLKAARLLVDNKIEFRLLLSGQGIDVNNAALVEKIREKRLNDHVILLGMRSDIPEFMNALDCHVLSSSCCEGFPNVIGEAMACEVPCVATDIGDSAMIIDDTGWIVAPGDPHALAKAMMEALIESPPLHAARGRRCRQRILDNFEMERITDMYYDMWVEDIKKRR